MGLELGTRLATYEVTGLRGKGGMGEVYRARDTRLKHEVAIKILPEESSREPERVGRFQREAEVRPRAGLEYVAAGIYRQRKGRPPDLSAPTGSVAGNATRRRRESFLLTSGRLDWILRRSKAEENFINRRSRYRYLPWVRTSNIQHRFIPAASTWRLANSLRTEWTPLSCR